MVEALDIQLYLLQIPKEGGAQRVPSKGGAQRNHRAGGGRWWSVGCGRTARVGRSAWVGQAKGAKGMGRGSGLGRYAVSG